MKTTWCEIPDSLLESNKIAKTFTKGPRCLIGFKTLQSIMINGTPYTNVKGVDFKVKSKRVEIATDKETVVSKYGEFNFVSVDNNLNFTLS